MDEGNFDVENSRLQIKKLKEKVKNLVSELDLSREIRSEGFTQAPKLGLESNLNDTFSILELSDVDSDEFLDIKEEDFTNETNWLLDQKSNCSSSFQQSGDMFSALYSEVDEFHEDISDLKYELQQLRNSSSSSTWYNRSSNRSTLIDSRTFTRPKKYASRPPLTSIVTNSSEDGLTKLQRRLTTTLSPSLNVINKIEDLGNDHIRPISGVHRNYNWEEGAVEGLADVENLGRKDKKKLPASIIDRLQELKKSNNSYINSRTIERSRHLNLINGNLEESPATKVREEPENVKIAFDLNMKNALSSSGMSDIFRNIPEYFSDDNESFFSLDEVSGFYDRLTLSTDPNTYSSVVKEMEQNEILFCQNDNPVEDAPLNRMTFGGREIPMSSVVKHEDFTSSKEQLLELDDDINKTYEVIDEIPPKANNTFVLIDNGNQSTIDINKKYDAENKSGFVDLIVQSDVLKTFNPDVNYRLWDNKQISKNDGNISVNNAIDNFSETENNELNKIHSDKFTTKIFDSSFRRISTSEGQNGKKDSDHSEDDCMSTTSDISYRSVDSNSELKNIEELKNIALQQNKRLSDFKFSTPKLENSKLVQRNSDGWRNISPIRQGMRDNESQGSSNASSRGHSPRRDPAPLETDYPRKSRCDIRPVKQPPKVAQRELKLKPPLMRPSQNFKKVVSYGKVSTEPVITQKNEYKSNASAANMPVVKTSMIPVTVSSASSTKLATRIPSGIPRPPSKLKPPQIRASELCKK